MQALIRCAILALLILGCGRGLRTSTPATPGTISNLIIWLNPEYFGIQGLANGTDLFSTLGNGHAWGGQNGIGLSVALISGAALYPSYFDSQCPNNHPSINNDNSGVYENSSPGIGTLSGFTAFYVGAFDIDQSQTVFSFSKDSTMTGADEYIFFGETGVNNVEFRIFNQSSFYGPTTGYVGATPYGYGLRWDPSSQSVSMIIEDSTSFNQHTASIPSSTTISAPATFRLYQDQANLFGYLNGYMCELLIYNRALSDDEMTIVREYLQGKYF